MPKIRTLSVWASLIDLILLQSRRWAVTYNPLSCLVWRSCLWSLSPAGFAVTTVVGGL